jgi:hypothetical protein
VTAETLEAPPMSRMLRVALIYADLGWPVLPCVPRDKRPMTNHGLKDATTDHEQIREWWGRTPDANLAIATGVAFDVLDIDELYRDDDGNVIGTPLDKWLPDDAPILVGPTVATGKGAHLYLAPTGLGNRAGVVPGVDWRGSGGYVVAPPSIHPNGATYRFERGSSDPEYGVAAPLVAPPSWLYELIAPKPLQPRTVSVSNGPGRKNLDSWARTALEAECGRVSLAADGTRNHQLNASAFSLGQIVAGGGLDVNEVIDNLLVAASRAGLDEGESRRTIASGLDSGSKQPRSVA